MKSTCWGGLAVSLLMVACGPSEKQKAQFAEEKRVHCLERSCEGDVEPAHDTSKEFAFKLKGQWFIGPREYGGYGGSLAFLWPSKTPARKANASKEAPEFVPSSAGVTSNFYEVGIEIFLRSNNIPPEPHGYALIALAQAKGWIASRNQMRPGLDVIQMRHVVGPDGYFIDHVTYYVATQLKGLDGLPPVATCAHARSDGSGGTGFMWQPGIWAGTRMNQKHCADWPEIYIETVRVLQLLRRA